MITIAVAGCGYWGPNLVRNFNALPEADMKVVCDLDSSRLAYMRNLYPEIQPVAAFNEVVNDISIDAVVIATPPPLHFAMARKSICSGKHVLVEKPMALSVGECTELIELAHKHGVTLMVSHTYIYTPAVREIRSILASGEIGTIFTSCSRRLNYGPFLKDVNVLWDLAPHDISILLFVLNEAPLSVNCQGKATVTPQIEDLAYLTLTFDQGGFSHIQNSWIEPSKVREMTFFGSKGTLIYNDVEPAEKIKIVHARAKNPFRKNAASESSSSSDCVTRHSTNLNHIEPLKVECQHFLECIMSGNPPDTGGVEGLQVIQVLEAASASLKKGGGPAKVYHYDQDIEKASRKVKCL
jgi:predicted dehydrogenase